MSGDARFALGAEDESAATRRLAGLVVVAAAAVWVWLTWSYWAHQNLGDDPFIHLTFAKNLAAGNGFVFNHPPARLGSTAPLHVLSVAALTALVPGATPVHAALALCLAAWIAAHLLVLHLLRGAGFGALPAALGAAVSLLCLRGWPTAIGMESFLFEALLLAALALHVARRPAAAGAAAALLALTRPEGALVGLLLLVLAWRRGRRALASTLVGAAVVAVPWTLYALETFGTLLPSTLSAKRMQADFLGQESFVAALGEELFERTIDAYELGGWRLASPLLIAAALGAVVLTRRRTVWLGLLAAWIASYLVGYELVGPLVYHWYVLHVLFALQLLAAAGIAWLASRVAAGDAGRRWLPAAAGAALVAGLLWANQPTWSSLRGGIGFTRGEKFRELALWLRESTAPTDEIALHDIGYVGYYTPNRVLDLAGCVDPRIPPLVRAGGIGAPLAVERPEVVVLIDGSPYNRTIRDALGASYAVVHTLRGGPLDAGFEVLVRGRESVEPR